MGFRAPDRQPVEEQLDGVRKGREDRLDPAVGDAMAKMPVIQ